MRNVYRLTGTCDKTGSTGNTLFFFYKSFFQNSSSFCLYSVYRRSCRFTVTLSQKQIVTLSCHTGLMQLSNRNRQQQLIQAAGMYRTNSDAAHTGYTTVCVCFFRMLYRDRLYRALCGALPTLHTRLICRRLQRNSVIGLIRMVSRYLQLTCRILFQMLPVHRDVRLHTDAGWNARQQPRSRHGTQSRFPVHIPSSPAEYPHRHDCHSCIPE